MTGFKASKGNSFDSKGNGFDSKGNSFDSLR